MMKWIKRLKNSLSTTKDTTCQTQNTNQSDLPTGSSAFDTTNTNYQILKLPEYIGGYDITPNFTVMLQTKPMWLHRYMTRILLGWKWKDSK